MSSIQVNFQYQIFENGFLGDIKSIKVTNRMLSQLKRDFEKLKVH
jgi:hypothetical protein